MSKAAILSTKRIMDEMDVKKVNGAVAKVTDCAGISKIQVNKKAFRDNARKAFFYLPKQKTSLFTRSGSGCLVFYVGAGATSSGSGSMR